MKMTAWLAAMVMVAALNGCGSGSGNKGTAVVAQNDSGDLQTKDGSQTTTGGSGAATQAGTTEGGAIPQTSAGTAESSSTSNVPATTIPAAGPATAPVTEPVATTAPTADPPIQPVTQPAPPPATTPTTLTTPATVQPTPQATTAPQTTSPTSQTPTTAGSAGGSSPSASTAPDSIQTVMISAINQARLAGRTCGATWYGPVTSVTWNERIAAAALKHSNDMAANGFFSHTGSDGSSAGKRLTEAGYIWSTYGENLAVGQSTPQAAVEAWLKSEGHCRNIMNPAFAEIGAGVAYGTYNGIASTPYWTLDLGRQR